MPLAHLLVGVRESCFDIIRETWTSSCSPSFVGVAQLVRASVSYALGREFESHPRHNELCEACRGWDWEGVGKREFPVKEGREQSDRWKIVGFQAILTPDLKKTDVSQFIERNITQIVIQAIIVCDTI